MTHSMWNSVISTGKEWSWMSELTDPFTLLIALSLVAFNILLYFLFKVVEKKIEKRVKEIKEIFDASLDETVSDLVYLMEQRKIKEEDKKIVLGFIEKAHNDEKYLLICKALRYYLKYESKIAFKNFLHSQNRRFT